MLHFDRIRPFSQILYLAGKACQSKCSGLFGFFVSDEEKSLIPSTISVNDLISLFSSTLTKRPNKLEGLSLALLHDFYARSSIYG